VPEARDLAEAAERARREHGPAYRRRTTPGEAGAPITAHDERGTPIHRGWMPIAGRRRWIEPFVLVLLARGGTYGYAILGRLEEMGVADGSLDVGLVYRTLRDLEEAGQVRSSWVEGAGGPRRRAYELTEAGYRALDQWAAVMRERARLIGEFNADYLDTVAALRPA
jgi:DNA-binding PadR family transcriptional regulator